MKKLALLVLLSLLACSEMYEVPETHYLIPVGKHESRIVGGFIGDKIRTLKRDRIEFTARFDETVRYDLGNRNQDDINKLMGFSEANQHHQQNSIRFGWRYLKASDNIEILAYAYQEGDQWYQSVAKVEINETVGYSIQIEDEAFILTVGESSLEVLRLKARERGLYYMLFPYFGGNETAPHDINIFISESFR